MKSYAEQQQFPQPWLKLNFTGRNVLIVDNDPSDRKLLREVLPAERYMTVEVEDGIEGLFALERTPIDIVVSEILLPNMDGYSLCSELRRRLEYNNVFFILYTAIDFTSNDVKHGLEVGANRLIGKRGAPCVILNAIEELIGESSERRSVYLRLTNNFPPMEITRYSAITKRQLEEKRIQLGQMCDALIIQIERVKRRLEN